MLLGSILGDIAPLAQPATRADPFLLENRIDNDRILAHLDGKFIMVGHAWEENLPNLSIYKPLKMRDPVRLLPLQHAYYSLFRSHLSHESISSFSLWFNQACSTPPRASALR